jgi:hypothetical protein
LHVLADSGAFGDYRAVVEWRQRASVIVGALVLALGNGCQARSSSEAAQTAIAVAQTAVPALPSMGDQIRPLLPGVAVDVRTTPPDAPNDAVTAVSIAGTDGSGTLEQLDPRARDGAASAVLVLAGRYYPKATIELDIKDANGSTLIHASRGPDDPQ